MVISKSRRSCVILGAFEIIVNLIGLNHILGSSRIHLHVIGVVVLVIVVVVVGNWVVCGVVCKSISDYLVDGPNKHNQENHS